MLNNFESNSIEIISLCVIILIAILIKRRKVKNRIWVRKWIEQRPQKGVYHDLLSELSHQDIPSYNNFLRMDQNAFKELANKIRSKIEKQITNFRLPISVEERLALTLRFLATGISLNL